MRIMTQRKRRSGTLVPFLVVLAVLTGCQAGPTEVQDAQNIEEQHRDAEQGDAPAQALSDNSAEEQQQAEVAPPPAKPPSANPAVVSADTWTDGDWPLTIDGGVLTCTSGAVFITDQDGEMWPLNGKARSNHARFGANPATEPIWRVDQKLMDAFPDSGATFRVGIGPLIKRGLSLCD